MAPTLGTQSCSSPLLRNRYQPQMIKMVRGCAFYLFDARISGQHRTMRPSHPAA